jgi:hypothetical protein
MSFSQAKIGIKFGLNSANSVSTMKGSCRKCQRPGLDQGTLCGPWFFHCKFSHKIYKISLVRCPCVQPRTKRFSRFARFQRCSFASMPRSFFELLYVHFVGLGLFFVDLDKKVAFDMFNVHVSWCAQCFVKT